MRTRESRYDPRARPKTQPDPTAVMSRVGEMIKDGASHAPAAGHPAPDAAPSATSISRRKIDYGVGGYDPKNRPGAAKAPPAPAVASDPVSESAPAEAAPMPASAPAAAAAAATPARRKIDYGVGGYNPAERSVERAPSSAAVPPSTSEANEGKPRSTSSPSISSKSSGPGDGDVGTQTNTGRFHKLVDFDHTGMDDKEFREALKEKMTRLREESPGNRCAGADTSTDFFFFVFFFVEELRRCFRTSPCCQCYKSSLNLHNHNHTHTQHTTHTHTHTLT